MPIAATNFYDLPPRPEGNIRFPRKVLAVKAIAIPERMDQSADNHFRLSVHGADARHRSAPLRNCLCHDNIPHPAQGRCCGPPPGKGLTPPRGRRGFIAVAQALGRYRKGRHSTRSVESNKTVNNRQKSHGGPRVAPKTKTLRRSIESNAAFSMN